MPCLSYAFGPIRYSSELPSVGIEKLITHETLRILSVNLFSIMIAMYVLKAL